MLAFQVLCTLSLHTPYTLDTTPCRLRSGCCGDASHLSDRDLRDARREYLVLDLALTHIDRGSVLDGLSVVAFSHIFRGLGWRDRLRMTQFAIANWQSTGTR